MLIVFDVSDCWRFENTPANKTQKITVFDLVSRCMALFFLSIRDLPLSPFSGSRSTFLRLPQLPDWPREIIRRQCNVDYKSHNNRKRQTSNGRDREWSLMPSNESINWIFATNKPEVVKPQITGVVFLCFLHFLLLKFLFVVMWSYFFVHVVLCYLLPFHSLVLVVDLSIRSYLSLYRNKMLRRLALLIFGATMVVAQRRLALPDPRSCANSKYYS